MPVRNLQLLDAKLHISRGTSVSQGLTISLAAVKRGTRAQFPPKLLLNLNFRKVSLSSPKSLKKSFRLCIWPANLLMDILRDSQLVIFSYSTTFKTFSNKSLAGFLFKFLQSSRWRKPELASDFWVWPLCKCDRDEFVRAIALGALVTARANFWLDEKARKLVECFNEDLSHLEPVSGWTENKSSIFSPVRPLTSQICTECLLAAVRRLFYQPSKTHRRDSIKRMTML